MKYLILMIFLFPLLCKAQTFNFQIGPSLSLYRNNGNIFGGQFLANVNVSKTLGLGAGTGVLQFKNDNEIYVPVYGVIRLIFPVKVIAISFDAYPGYGIYNKTNITGGFYFSSGLTLKLHRSVSPFISLHYTKYEYHETIIYTSTISKITQGEDAFTVAAGLCFKFGKP